MMELAGLSRPRRRRSQGIPARHKAAGSKAWKRALTVPRISPMAECKCDTAVCACAQICPRCQDQGATTLSWDLVSRGFREA